MKGLGQNKSEEDEFDPQSFRRFSQYEFSTTLYGLIGFALLIALPIGLLWTPTKFWGLYIGTGVGLCITLLVLIAARTAQLMLSQKRREQILRAYARKHSYNYGTSDLHRFVDSLGVIAEIAIDYNDFKLKNILETPHWTYSDFAHVHRGNPTYGSPALWRAHYGVVSVGLPQELPNIFFDSKKAFGSQFKRRIDQRQVRNMEEYFDEHFTTYFPQDYSINGLEIITPEVMIALLDADNYDIEIYGNRVLLYGAPVTSITQLEDMTEKAKKIGIALLNTIRARHERHLPLPEGRLSVSPEGKLVNQGSFWAMIALLLVGLYMLPYAVMFLQIMYVWITQGWTAASSLY